MKKITSILLTVILAAVLLMPAAVYADELPHAFWAIDDQYSAAVDSSNYQATVTYGMQAVELLSNYPETEQIRNIMASRLDKVGIAYEHLGDYPNAASVYSRYIPYAQKLGWDDGVKIASAKVKHYTPYIRAYTYTDTPQLYYGAKNEPEKGVLFGKAYAQNSGYGDASAMLVYLEFGDSNLHWVKSALSDAKEKGLAVELAWNFPNEGSGLGSIPYQNEYIKSVTSMIAEYPTVPVFVRIGAEMNVWTIPADPNEYKAAFRHISGIIKSDCQNAAVVWSPGTASSWDKNMEDYYPGDEYVDWVGASLYAGKYFLGKIWPEEQKFNEVVFGAGDGADPVKMLDEIATKFGDRKPIMIAECGAAHTVRSLGEDTTDWAKMRLRQIYSYLPMYYPQVKFIAYFDVVMPSETNDYALSSNSALAEEYKSIISSTPMLIKENAKNAPADVCQKLTDGFVVQGSTFKVSSYVHLFGINEPSVNYFVDGTWVGGGSAAPYTQKLDLSGFSSGEHTLTITASNGFSRSYSFEKQNAISLYVNNKIVETDTMPISENDRTLVPIRVVSESLGAQVGWDEKDEIVTVTDGSTKIRLAIGNKSIIIIKGSKTYIYESDVPARLVNSRTMVPIRAVAEILGADVKWDEGTQSVYITK